MSVNDVFGLNQRALCAQRPSIAAVARDLGIGKVQFHRYLNGESFPKPNVLSKICDYFDVDGRILLEALEDQTGLSEATVEDDRAVSGWIEAADYLCRGQKLFDNADDFPDGLYANWRESHSHPGKYLVALLQVKTLDTARVLRGHDVKQMSEGIASIRRSDREYRGVLLRQTDGYCGLFFHAPTNPLMSVVYYRPVSVGLPGPTFCGRAIVARPARQTVTNASNSVLTKLPGRLSASLDVLRKKPFFGDSEVPGIILNALRDGS